MSRPTDKSQRNASSAPTAKGGGKKRKQSRRWLWPAGILAAIVAAGVCAGVWLMTAAHRGHDAWVMIPSDATEAQVRDSLVSSLGNSEGKLVYGLWQAMGGKPGKAHGAYRIAWGQNHLATARRMKRGAETPVKLQWQNIRTLDSLAQRVSAQMELSPDEFKDACRRVLGAIGYSEAEWPAAFLPDTYEMYWSSKPDDVVTRLLSYRNRFWNDERVAKAERLGISPIEAATIASIVEEESVKSDERPKIARLYLNRLQRGMALQADPTVKFATGNFGLRRITGEHLGVNSPYNTYKHTGLPPGPIRIASRQGIDAVLNAPANDYLYMCAKEDFSGYHNFAADYATHQANARRYRDELNRRNIH